jgi:hypothetical protein
MSEVKDMYLRLTPDEVEDIKIALHSQYANSDNLNFVHENDELVQKICNQENSICRPYVVQGTHYHNMLMMPRRIVVMAEDEKWAAEYAQEHVEKEGGRFEVNHVHVMRDDEFIFAEDVE